MAELQDFLSRTFIFRELDTQDLKMVADLFRSKSYSRGEIIFMEEEPGEAIFLLLSGRIKLTKMNADGREQILHFVEPGGLFAEVVLMDSGPYPATAQVVEQAEVGILTNSDFERLLLSHPTISIQMVKMMSRRLRAAQRTIRDLALQDAYGRMAALLLRWCAKEGKQNSRGIFIPLHLTRKEVAEFIGTSRETVARILSRFQKEGIIDIQPEGILVVDREGLEEWNG